MCRSSSRPGGFADPSATRRSKSTLAGSSLCYAVIPACFGQGQMVRWGAMVHRDGAMTRKSRTRVRWSRESSALPFTLEVVAEAKPSAEQVEQACEAIRLGLYQTLGLERPEGLVISVGSVEVPP